MRIDSARAFFEALAARSREPRLADATGTWEFDVQGAGTWTVTVDRGAIVVAEGRPSDEPRSRLRLDEDELLRLVHGDHHENLFTALLRGALRVQGELAFVQKLQSIFPVPEEWRVEA